MQKHRPRLIGLPYDANSSFLRGAAEAPPLIRAALRSSAGNMWTEDLHDLGVEGVLTDAGDLDLASTGDVRERITSTIGSLFRDGARPIALGGDHSVTYPV